MADKLLQLNLGPEVDGASIVYDLKPESIIDDKKIGLGIDVLSIISIAFRDNQIEKNFQLEFASIYNDISDSIQNDGLGYLLEIVIYKDESGFIYLPQGRLINPIGVGVEPLDSMAKYLNTDRLTLGGIPPSNYKNSSSFLWIKRQNNNLIARSIPNSYYDFFVEQSKREGERRRLMGEWMTINTITSLKQISVANSWNEIEIKKLQTLQSVNEKNEAIRLRQEMEILQNKTNELYSKFQQTQIEMVNAQKLQNTITAIGSVANLIKNGIEVNEIACKDDKILKNTDKTNMLDLQEIQNITSSRLTDLNQINTNLTVLTQQSIDELGVINTQLSVIYNEQVKPKPTLENNPKLQLP